MATDSGTGGPVRRPRADERTLRFIADADRRLQSLHGVEQPDRTRQPESLVPRRTPPRPRPAARSVKTKKNSSPKARFHERVERKAVLLSAPDQRTRTVHSPAERIELREAARREATWLPIWAVLTVASSAVVTVVICVQILGIGSADTVVQRAACGLLVIAAIVACASTLLRIQAYYQRMRPQGRTVPRDIADAYDVVRDAPELLASLGLPPDRLGRAYDLLPSVEPLVDFLALNATASPGALRASNAYRQLIHAAAEVHVLIETCEEQLGLREPWGPGTYAVVSGPTSSLADLAELIAPKRTTS